MGEIFAWIILCVSFGGPVAFAVFFRAHRNGPNLTDEQQKALFEAKRSTTYVAVTAVIVLCVGVWWQGNVPPFTWDRIALVLVGAAILGFLARLTLGKRLLKDR